MPNFFISKKSRIFVVTKKNLMKTKSNPPSHLKVSQKDIREFNEKRVEHVLGFFNRIMNACVYMVDYRTPKIMFGNVANPTVSGFSREILKQEGFNIYKKILSEEELSWLMNMQEASRRVYFRYNDFEERIALEFSYDLIGIAKNEIGRAHV